MASFANVRIVLPSLSMWESELRRAVYAAGCKLMGRMNSVRAQRLLELSLDGIKRAG